MFKQNAAAIIAGLAILTAAPAFADIKAYNAAVQRGDYSAAAAEVGPIWAGYDKTSEDAIVIAREFAWMSMLAGKSDQAEGIAHWLVEQGQKAPHPDQHPLTAMVLLRWSELGDTPTDRTINALSDAVAARAAVTGESDRISAVAAKQLYLAEWKLGHWGDVERDAAIASRLATRLGEDGVQLKIDSQIDAIAAEFMGHLKIDPYFKMAAVREEIIRRLGRDPEGLEDNGVDTPMELLNHRASVWMEAMMTHYGVVEPHAKAAWSTDYKRALALQVAGACQKDDCAQPATPGETVLCHVKWNLSAQTLLDPFQPLQTRLKGTAAALRLRVKTDEKGKVIDVKLITAVPPGDFPDALTAARKSIATRGDGQPADCRLAGWRLMDITYQFGR